VARRVRPGFLSNPYLEGEQWQEVERLYREGKFGPTYDATPTYTGFSADPTAIMYRVLDALIIIEGASGGTSNATGFTFTIPENIWPEATVYLTCIAQDSGNDVLAKAEISTSGTVTMYISSVVVLPNPRVEFSSTGWTNTGTKGLQGPLIYLKNNT
jgi:hypothetical protein